MQAALEAAKDMRLCRPGDCVVALHRIGNASGEAAGAGRGAGAQTRLKSQRCHAMLPQHPPVPSPAVFSVFLPPLLTVIKLVDIK